MNTLPNFTIDLNTFKYVMSFQYPMKTPQSIKIQQDDNHKDVECRADYLEALIEVLIQHFQ